MGVPMFGGSPLSKAGLYTVNPVVDPELDNTWFLNP
jgi:hypothetical protein